MKIENAYRVTLSTEIEVIIKSDMPIDEAHVDDTCAAQTAICKKLILLDAPRLDKLGWHDKYGYTIKSKESKISRCQLKELDITNVSNRNVQ